MKEYITLFSFITKGRIRILHVTGMDTPVTNFPRICRLESFTQIPAGLQHYEINFISIINIVNVSVWHHWTEAWTVCQYSQPQSCQDQREGQLPSHPAKDDKTDHWDSGSEVVWLSHTWRPANIISTPTFWEQSHHSSQHQLHTSFLYCSDEILFAVKLWLSHGCSLKPMG